MKHIKLMCAAVSFINIIISSGALAQGRPLTTAMSCNQAQSLVATQGSVVLNTSATAYERYVASGAYCGLGEVPGPGWAPTKDVPQCPVGSRCVGVSRGR
jgi:hypothetical protein